MERMIKKIKEYFDSISNKEIMRNLFIILIVGIILFLIADIFIGKDKKYVNNIYELDSSESLTNNYSDYSSLLEKKLEDILSQLKGVGKVKVMITLEDTTEVVPAFNTTKNNETTKENDAQGGTREIVREDMTIQVVTNDNGEPIVLKEIRPTIKGVIVLADGAEDLYIKEMLYEAVKTALGIPGNRVEVYSSN
ncbi:MAG: sporulation stage III protein AG [Tissierellia bacterium]|nr:sporulation stage III protein AG [Tissierellia bacterium]